MTGSITKSTVGLAVRSTVGSTGGLTGTSSGPSPSSPPSTPDCSLAQAHFASSSTIISLSIFKVKIRIVNSPRMVLHCPPPQKLKAFKELAEGNDTKSFQHMEFNHSLFTFIRNLQLHLLDFLVLLNGEHFLCPQLIRDFLQFCLGLICLVHRLNQVFPQPRTLSFSCFNP